MPRNLTPYLCPNGPKRPVGFLIAFCAAAMFAASAGAAEPGVRVVVVVHNQARLPSETLVLAQTQASAIFEQAGVSIDWWEPLKAESGIVFVPAVKPPVSIVRLLPDSVRPPAVSGAWGGAAGDQANIFTGPILQAAKKASLAFPRILGGIIAHELGHILLEDTGHVLGSIMCPELREWELREMQWGTLRFTPAQAKQMRDRIRALEAAEGVGPVSQ